MALYTCPRISFSVDFANSSQLQNNSYREAPVSSDDFEFFGFAGPNDPTSSSSSMISADELFFKGRMLPSKESCPKTNTTTTLRDELLANEEDGDHHNLPTRRPVKGACRWRERLGFKRSHKKGMPMESWEE